MKIKFIRVVTPALTPPRQTINLVRSEDGPRSAEYVDHGILCTMNNGRLFLVPWANIVDVEMEQEKTPQKR